MRRCLVLMCFALAGCGTVQSGVDSVARGFGSLGDRMEAVFVGPARLYEDMTDSDVALAVAAMQNALETRPGGETVAWINDETGNQGAVTPQRTFITDRGVFCRDYNESIEVGGKSGVVENTACRTEAGRWAWLG